MTALRTSATRHVLAALLVLVLTLAGVGRGLAVAGDTHLPLPTIAGVIAPICHSDGSDSSNPADPNGSGHHDCRDQCTLCAAVIPSASPAIADVTPVEHELRPAAIVAWKVRLARARTPRQSQGPPAA